jgi:GDPmannose 4,6-dehydratase
VKLYNACSRECFGSLDNAAADEKTPFNPSSPYAVTKAAAYWQVSNYRQAYNIFACSGILFNHESPLRPERFVTQKIISAARRIAAGNSEQLDIGNITIERDWGWAPEYVEAMWRMLQQPQPDDFVIGTGESNSLQEFIQTTFESVGLTWQDHVKVNRRLLRPSELQFSKSNPQKAESKLGWKARYRMKDVIRFMLNDTLLPNPESTS